MKQFFLKLKQAFSRFDFPKIRIPSEIIGMAVVFLLMSAAFIPSFNLAPKHTMTSGKFVSVCEKYGYKFQNVTDEYYGIFFDEVLAAKDEGYCIEHYTFSHRAFSKALYTHYLSTVQNHSMSEQYKYTASYNRFYKSEPEGIVFLYRNEDKIIFLSGNAEHIETIDELIKKMKL